MPVTVDHEEHVAVVTLDRPEKRNAMDAEMTAALDDALNRLDDDPAVRVIVLASSSKVFSAGTDLRTGSGGPTGRGGPYGIARRAHGTPIVAAVEGAALGGGFEIVLACDLVVASTGASFGLPEVSRGVVATCGGLFRAPRALPLNLATELLLTGDPIDARRAAELGLVNRMTEEGGALREAVALATRIARNSPVAVAATLRAVHLHAGALDQLGWSPPTMPHTRCSPHPTPPRASAPSSNAAHPPGRGRHSPERASRPDQSSPVPAPSAVEPRVS
jgi:enoyl-CoA hydratase/carnithine racemase